MRISFIQMAMEMAEVAAKRSEDPYVKVGAVVLRQNNTIASIGYNGAPAGVEIDWSDRDLRRNFVIHAEQNALNYVTPNDGFTICSTLSPCADCLKAAAMKGIKRFFYKTEYQLNDIALISKVAQSFGIYLSKI